MIKWIWTNILTLVYRAKHRSGLGNINKVTEVVMSCSTPGQCEAAEQYIALYRARFIEGRKEDGMTRTAERVLEQFTLYLKDTCEHYERGCHVPEHNGGEPVTTSPNMNDYVGRVLNVRFKPFWQRGVPSVVRPN